MPAKGGGSEAVATILSIFLAFRVEILVVLGLATAGMLLAEVPLPMIFLYLVGLILLLFLMAALLAAVLS